MQQMVLQNVFIQTLWLKFKIKAFVNVPGMDSTHMKYGALQHTRLRQRKLIKHINGMPSFA